MSDKYKHVVSVMVGDDIVYFYHEFQIIFQRKSSIMREVYDRYN